MKRDRGIQKGRYIDRDKGIERRGRDRDRER